MGIKYDIVWVLHETQVDCKLFVSLPSVSVFDKNTTVIKRPDFQFPF